MKYELKEQGEEWSRPWGNSAAQWTYSIFPRIRDCLPAKTILEIAPGLGRWTQYLKEHCEDLWIVDRSARCIDFCRERFAAEPRIRCYLNDGRSLSMLADDSIDFVFSFDSLVHTRPEVIEAYLAQLSAKLKIGGKGFFHHSNLGQYADSARARLPSPVRKLLVKTKLIDWEHNRQPNMTAEIFRKLCAQHGLHCFKQELLNWRSRRLIDCFSWFIRDGSQTKIEITRNPNFMREAESIRQRSLHT